MKRIAAVKGSPRPVMFAAAGAQAPVGTPQIVVFVTAPSRDGFVDTNKDIQDTVRTCGIVNSDKEMMLADTPECRHHPDGCCSGTGSQQYGSRTDITHYYGGTQLQSRARRCQYALDKHGHGSGAFKKELSAAYTNSSAL